MPIPNEGGMDPSRMSETTKGSDDGESIDKPEYGCLSDETEGMDAYMREKMRILEEADASIH